MDQQSTFLESATDEEIGRAADFIVQLFRAPLVLGNGEHDLEKVFELMKRAASDPEKLKRDIIDIARKADPHEVTKGLAVVQGFMRAPRKMVLQIIASSLPLGTPGRRPLVTPENERRMTEMAAILWPAVQNIIELRQGASKRTLVETLRYLEADHPSAIPLLLKHLQILEAFFAAQPRSRGKRKTYKARDLIFGVISKEFGISKSYARRWLGPSLTALSARN